MKKLVLAVLTMSSLSFAAPPPAAGDDRKAELGKKMHLMLVLGVADALGLNEAEALKMSDKLKGFEEKRRPTREAMGEALKTLKAASEGDATAAASVDAAVQKLFEGRQQMAALDKEMFAGLSKDLSPQKRAQLAVFLARFHAEAKGDFFKGDRFKKARL